MTFTCRLKPVQPLSTLPISDPVACACCAVRPEMGQSSGGSLAALQLSETLVPTQSPLPPASALQ